MTMETNHGQDFHDQMHKLIFRGAGASRLGAVQTTLVWQFVISHYPTLAVNFCQQLISLQKTINDAPRNTIVMENAIASLLNHVKKLDTGGR